MNGKLTTILGVVAGFIPNLDHVHLGILISCRIDIFSNFQCKGHWPMVPFFGKEHQA